MLVMEFAKVGEFEINEKFKQLEQVKSGEITKEQLAATITRRRIRWLEDNLGDMLRKYKNLSPEEVAYRIIFLEHMLINPDFLHVIRASPTKIEIHSYNSCPYLGACKKLGLDSLDTRIVCKEIGEPSIREMAKMINPNVKFSRDYSVIRPNWQFCMEFFERI